jgi:hypothetical protein
MALTQVTTNAIADDAVTTDKLANAINTARDANTAKATNATHSGEVTGSGALTITDDTVDEANLKISNAGSNGQFLQKQSGNTGGLTWASVSTTDSTKMPLAGGTFTGDVTFDNQSTGGRDIIWDESDDALEFLDNTKATFGNDGDLKIYHNGTDNYIMPSNGKLIINNGSDTLAQFISDGAVELYYDNSKKLATSTDGIVISNGSLYLSDYSSGDGYIGLGDSQDLQLWHDGSNSYIKNYAGDLYITANSSADDVYLVTGSEIRILTDNSNESSIICTSNAGVELFYDGSKKLWTRSDGIEVTGKGVFSNHIYLPDDVKLIMGDNPDLEIKHESNLSTIKNTHANGLAIRSDIVMLQNAAGDHDYLTTVNEEGVSLYYDNNLRFKTNSGGCQLRGTINYVETLLRPWTATGVDLGTSDDRFQNLYLHGNLYLGGTGSSNAMDDYEEGDWTPDLGNMVALSFNNRTGKYTKVGRFVYASCYMNIASRTGGGGHLLLTGLPFTSHNTNASGNGFIGYSAGLTGDTYDVPTIYIGSNATQAYFYKGNGSTFASQDIDFSSGSMHITFVYESA